MRHARPRPQDFESMCARPRCCVLPRASPCSWDTSCRNHACGILPARCTEPPPWRRNRRRPETEISFGVERFVVASQTQVLVASRRCHLVRVYLIVRVPDGLESTKALIARDRTFWRRDEYASDRAISGPILRAAAVSAELSATTNCAWIRFRSQNVRVRADQGFVEIQVRLDRT